MGSLLVTSHAVRCRGATFQGTMLPKRNGHYGKGRRMAPNTFILEGVSDKGHPYFYCNAAELVRLLNGFELVFLGDHEQLKAGSYLWHLVA
jgi:tellurite methyltransferase